LNGKYHNIDIRHSHTSYKHFNFTGDEVAIQCWYLNDDELERWQAVFTQDRDSCSVGYSAWIPTTYFIVPRSWCGDNRVGVRQTDDEIVILVSYVDKISRRMSWT